MTIKEYQEYVRNGASDKYTKEIAPFKMKRIPQSLSI